MNDNITPKYSDEELIKLSRDVFKKAEESQASSNQTCPICGDKVVESERYPIYVCNKDVERATAENGRELIFGNISASGGFMAYYKDDMSVAEDIMKSHKVFINGIPFHADERYMGGIVVTPISK